MPHRSRFGDLIKKEPETILRILGLGEHIVSVDFTENSVHTLNGGSSDLMITEDYH